MHRGDNYDEELSTKLKNVKFAQAYLVALIDDESDMTAEAALKHAIERMGIKEFADAAKVPTSNVQEFLKGTRKLKPETLDQYLKPFGLRTKIILEEAS